MVVDGGRLILDPRIPLLRKGLQNLRDGWLVVVDGGWWFDPRVSHPLSSHGFSWLLRLDGGRWFDPRSSHPLATQGFAASPGWMVDGGRWWSIDPRVSLPLATQGFANSPGWMFGGRCWFDLGFLVCEVGRGCLVPKLRLSKSTP